MAASPMHVERGDLQPHDKWANSDDQGGEPMGPAGDGSASNGGPVSDDRAGNDPVNTEYARSNAGGDTVSGKSGTVVYREKQIKPNKVYIGGLPENTRQEDLQSCFGKIGSISNIELKVGYGFVEFEKQEAAEESIAKYNDGFFMGNKIRVEQSNGGGRYAKYSSEPGACFKECPNHVMQTSTPGRRPPPGEAHLIDRIRPVGDYLPPPPPRDYPPPPHYRDDLPPGRYPPSRDARYPYDYPPPRRPLSPPRDHRDYYPPPPPRRGDIDDYRMRGPPPPRYDSRAGYYPPDDSAGYPRGYPPPPPRDYDRYDRRQPPPAGDRFPPYPPPPAGMRPRTPPPGLPRAREEFERPPMRDYPPPPPEYRGRPITPPPSRYVDYPPRTGGSEGRYRRRSQSPPPRTSGAGYDSYPAGPSGYSAAPTGPPKVARDYPPRGGRDTAEANGSYRRP